MTWLVRKDDTSIRYQPWDVRHTIEGKWAVTTRHDPFYGNAFNMAEEVFDGKRWRPRTDVQQIDTPTPYGWLEMIWVLPMDDN